MRTEKRTYGFAGGGPAALLRVVLGAVFIASGASKIAEPSSFADTIALYGLVPADIIPYIAIILPWIEFFCGILLAAGFRIRAASLLSAGMLCLFTALIGFNVALGKSFACGCIAGLDAGPFSRIGWPLLARNTVLLILTAFVLFAKRHPLSADHLLEKRGLRK
mgnify:CR=1 FL=1